MTLQKIILIALTVTCFSQLAYGKDTLEKKPSPIGACITKDIICSGVSSYPCLACPCQVKSTCEEHSPETTKKKLTEDT